MHGATYLSSITSSRHGAKAQGQVYLSMFTVRDVGSFSVAVNISRQSPKFDLKECNFHVLVLKIVFYIFRILHKLCSIFHVSYTRIFMIRRPGV